MQTYTQSGRPGYPVITLSSATIGFVARLVCKVSRSVGRAGVFDRRVIETIHFLHRRYSFTFSSCLIDQLVRIILSLHPFHFFSFRLVSILVAKFVWEGSWWYGECRDLNRRISKVFHNLYNRFAFHIIFSYSVDRVFHGLYIFFLSTCFPT